jgi:hypothetical protein
MPAVFDADAEADIGAKTMGSRQTSTQHSHYSGGLCTCRLEVLSIFGISLGVFQVVGEMIIAYIGSDPLSGRHTVAQAPPSDGEYAEG